MKVKLCSLPRVKASERSAAFELLALEKGGRLLLEDGDGLHRLKVCRLFPKAAAGYLFAMAKDGKLLYEDDDQKLHRVAVAE